MSWLLLVALLVSPLKTTENQEKSEKVFLIFNVNGNDAIDIYFPLKF